MTEAEETSERTAGQGAPLPRRAQGADHLFHGYLSLQARGLVALPTGLRKRYALDAPGAQVELTEREDGVLELRPMVAVPASDAWYWSERWNAGERRVDEHVARGEVIVSESTEEFLADLAELDEQASAADSGDTRA